MRSFIQWLGEKMEKDLIGKTVSTTRLSANAPDKRAKPELGDQARREIPQKTGFRCDSTLQDYI